MAPADRVRILTISAGSSSLKAAVYALDRTERLIFALQVERIGQSDRHMRIVDGNADTFLYRRQPAGTWAWDYACAEDLIGKEANDPRAADAIGLFCHLARLDAERNDRHGPIISRDSSRVMVRVMKTEEDLMIARHVRHLLSTTRTAATSGPTRVRRSPPTRGTAARFGPRRYPD